MSYTIGVRVIQKDPLEWFSIVENTVWKDGAWAENDGEQTVTMGDSGTSGTLRFMSSKGEYFQVALGVHNNARWCDVWLDLNASNTGVELHPEYYGEGSRNSVPAQQNPNAKEKSAKGTTIIVKYYVTSGNDLKATITINV